MLKVLACLTHSVTGLIEHFTHAFRIHSEIFTDIFRLLLRRLKPVMKFLLTLLERFGLSARRGIHSAVPRRQQLQQPLDLGDVLFESVGDLGTGTPPVARSFLQTVGGTLGDDPLMACFGCGPQSTPQITRPDGVEQGLGGFDSSPHPFALVEGSFCAFKTGPVLDSVRYNTHRKQFDLRPGLSDLFGGAVVLFFPQGLHVFLQLPLLVL